MLLRLAARADVESQGARLPTPHADSTLDTSLLHRLGVSARLRDGELLLELTPQPHILRHGVVRASMVSFLVDGVAGIHADDDDMGMWTLTSDLSVGGHRAPIDRIHPPDRFTL